METLAVLLVLGAAFAVFAVLGPAERAAVCDHGRPGDPACEHCPLDGDTALTVGVPPEGSAPRA